jgi:hypothetical protein
MTWYWQIKLGLELINTGGSPPIVTLNLPKISHSPFLVKSKRQFNNLK